MPNIIPTNPIQKLLFELQRQKEQEQQRAIYIQHDQNVAAQMMNEQIMQQQQNKIQNEIQQTYYNNMQNKYEHNGNIAVNSNNQVVQQNNIKHNQVIKHPQESESADADKKGEF
jgi:ABC-type sugar transport system ATPase subunit